MSPPPDATSPPDATTRPPDPTSQPPKRYASQVRDEQARRTRRAIVTAAHDLFLAQGYAATTIDGIAEAAHVSRRTVFNSVGGKVALLKLALDWAIVGDDEPIALADRPAIKAILAESDPRKALMLWVQTVTDVAARTTPLGEVLIAAADIDPAAAQLLAEASRNRMLGATVFIRYLASLDGLAVGITEQRAAELCWALTDGHLYRLLVAQRSWSTADFNRWLSDSLAAALLPTWTGRNPAIRRAQRDVPLRVRRLRSGRFRGTTAAGCECPQPRAPASWALVPPSRECRFLG